VATIAEIRDGLADRLETISGLRVHDTWPGQISPPVAIVANGETRYDVTLDGVDDSTFTITVFVQFANDRVAQDALDAYRSPSGASSIATAVHGDPTLGGIVDFARVVSASPDKITPYAGVEYLACDFTVEVGD
jgi:hypothetical protein